MARKKKTGGTPAPPSALDAPGTVLSHAAVEVLDDGRVEARLSDHPDSPVKEVVVRTTQPEAARFIMNDLCPQALTAIADEG